MKTTMKVMLLGLALLFAVCSAQAQKVSLEERAQTETNELAASLSLDEEMKGKVYEVYLIYANKQNEISKEYRIKKKAGEEIDEEERKKRMKALRQEKNGEINEVLGEDLAKKYRAIRKDKREGQKNAKKEKG